MLSAPERSFLRMTSIVTYGLARGGKKKEKGKKMNIRNGWTKEYAGYIRHINQTYGAK